MYLTGVILLYILFGSLRLKIFYETRYVLKASCCFSDVEIVAIRLMILCIPLYLHDSLVEAVSSSLQFLQVYISKWVHLHL